MGQIKGLLANATGSEAQGGIGFYTRPVGGAGQLLTERMRITNDGFIGISTTDPKAKIDILGGSAQDGSSGSNMVAFQFNGGGYRHFIKTRHSATAGTGNGVEFYLNNSNTAGGSSTAGTGNSLIMSITGGGVGIGITTPLTELDVSGVLTLRGGTTASVFNDATNTYMSFAANGASTDWVNLRQIGGANAFTLAYDFHDDATDVRFVLRNNSAGTPWEVLRVDNDPSTGVNGTMQVTQRNSAAATAIPTLSLQNSSNGHQINFLTNSGTGSFNSIAQINDKSIIFHNGTQNTGNLVIAPWSATGVTSGIRMNTSGQVGIGRSTPAFTLDVSGTGRFTSDLTVNGSFNITPAGSIMIWSTNTAPSGWLLCDGTSYTTTAQATLFAVISYTYGGSGANFNVPNMKQRVPVGRDATDASFNTIGYTSGEKTHILTEAEMPSHTHDYKFPTGQTAQGGGGDTVAEDNFSLALTKTSVATGGGGAHNNMQPYMVLNYIIKT